jgi:putative nucleotidyltransferase with HDIG domain
LADGALYRAKRAGRDRVVVFSEASDQPVSAEEQTEHLRKEQALVSLRVLARVVDAKDPTTRTHSVQVAALAMKLARSLEWPDARVSALHEAALVHDIGKIGVPDAVLLKPAALDPDEYEVVKRHVEVGAEMVAVALTPEQVSWVRHHHEHVDGRGYPDGLSGDDIPGPPRRSPARRPRGQTYDKPGTMVLTGHLSNRELTALLVVLTARDWEHAPRRFKKNAHGSPDGRRSFGTVSSAIIEVLKHVDSDLRVRDIHKEVERLLGGPVSRSSIKNYLHKDSKRAVPLFEHRGRAGYRLLRR